MAERGTPAKLPDCFDPYLRYAISTEFTNFRDHLTAKPGLIEERRTTKAPETFDDHNFRLLLLIELKEAGMAPEFEKALKDLGSAFCIELGPDIGDFSKTRYLTMRCRTSAVTDPHLQQDFWTKYVSRVELSLPVRRSETLGFLERAGHEIVDVHSLREHYVWTVRPWLDTLQRHRETATRMIGEEQWRIWLLYLAGAALAFEQNRMGVHQILAVRPGQDGASGLPRSRTGVLGLDPALDGAAAAPGQVTLR